MVQQYEANLIIINLSFACGWKPPDGHWTPPDASRKKTNHYYMT
ncbi:23782_t:CDS:2 [Cetraspora pellucida]|uniref:23782_t:CDS:1 n=1 Tax=Cetraspora pellucida TaxID=1433469 RepID=A0A9N9F4Y5_9GLOM|nr:23782_t:CDS:2 [Cetraspora pellucida]